MTAPVTDSRLKPLLEVSAWLADRHEKDQETVADNLILGFFPLWQLVRFNELDASTVPFVQATLPEVEKAFLQSQRLAVAYVSNARYAELTVDLPLIFDFPEVQRPVGVSADSFRVPRVEVPGAVEQQQRLTLDRFDSRDVAKTLVIESNYMTKRAMPGPEQEIMQNASVRTAGAAVREAINGGRGVANLVTKRDRKVKGFARVTDSNPCPLCALLASRGAVYGKGGFINSDKKFKPHPEASRDTPEGWTNIAKVHDNCRCMLRPVWTVAGGMDAAAMHYKQLWDEQINKRGDLSGKEKKRAEMKQWREVVRDNPFDGNQFDLNIMRRELDERADALLDEGLPPNDPRVRWTDTMKAEIASAA